MLAVRASAASGVGTNGDCAPAYRQDRHAASLHRDAVIASRVPAPRPELVTRLPVPGSAPRHVRPPTRGPFPPPSRTRMRSMLHPRYVRSSLLVPVIAMSLGACASD